MVFAWIQDWGSAFDSRQCHYGNAGWHYLIYEGLVDAQAKLLRPLKTKVIGKIERMLREGGGGRFSHRISKKALQVIP